MQPTHKSSRWLMTLLFLHNLDTKRSLVLFSLMTTMRPVIVGVRGTGEAPGRAVGSSLNRRVGNRGCCRGTVPEANPGACGAPPDRDDRVGKRSSPADGLRTARRIAT